ncbi:hypothetical protein GSI_13420 [Ganoderma sinense ZZ0214-1]|uniref:Ribonuclease H1 N-terminal domain-containing protein n=1 Tax=Ganoderma sinense ZZ0214-1 TaxID=1077348 RepID=A0A2G8RQ99_9APHY|nr:hypothetical protein GSI_13420 [Ganoderma sinense ZZ0214-1]
MIYHYYNRWCVTVHSHNSPVNVYTGPTPAEGEGARLATRALRSGTPNIPAPHRVLHPTSDGPPSIAGPRQVPPVAQSLLFETGPIPALTPQVQSLPDTPASGTASLPADLPTADLAEHDQDEYIAPPNIIHTGKWHVVITGRQVGMWSDWLHMAKYVTSIPGNCHKSFPTRMEALTWYYAAKEDGGVVVIAP